MTHEKTRKLLSKEDYPFGTPTQLTGKIRSYERRKSNHPWGIKIGYHLVRVNSNTWIEVKDGHNDDKARTQFILKLEASQMAFYNNLTI